MQFHRRLKNTLGGFAVLIIASCARDNESHNKDFIYADKSAPKEIERAYHKLIELTGGPPDKFHLSKMSTTTASYNDTILVSFEYNLDAISEKVFFSEFIFVDTSMILKSHGSEVPNAH